MLFLLASGIPQKDFGGLGGIPSIEKIKNLTSIQYFTVFLCLYFFISYIYIVSFVLILFFSSFFYDDKIFFSLHYTSVQFTSMLVLKQSVTIGELYKLIYNTNYKVINKKLQWQMITNFQSSIQNSNKYLQKKNRIYKDLFFYYYKSCQI